MSKKSAGKKSKSPDALPPDALTLARHPRARVQIRRVRAQVALLAFVVVIFLSARAGLPTADAWLRGLLGGIVAYVATWAVAVVVWRHLALAEVEAAHQRVLARRRAATQGAADAGSTRGDR